MLTSIWAARKTHNWLHSPQPHPASVTFLPSLSPHWVAPASQLPHLPPPQQGDLPGPPGAAGSCWKPLRGLGGWAPHPGPTPTCGTHSPLHAPWGLSSLPGAPLHSQPLLSFRWHGWVCCKGGHCPSPPEGSPHTSKKDCPPPLPHLSSPGLLSPEIWHPWELNIDTQRLAQIQ